MKHLKTINELHQHTYRDASKALAKLGHSVRSQAVKAHGNEMELRQSREDYNIGKCTFEGGQTGEFICFDEYMSLDVYMDTNYGPDGYETLFFPLFFSLEDGDPNNEWLQEEGPQFSPFSIFYNVGKKTVGIEIGTTEDANKEFFDAEKILFNNRQDALKIINELKNLDFKPEFKALDGFDQWYKRFQEMVHGNKEEGIRGISINEMWKPES